jgi:hypothetical protein
VVVDAAARDVRANRLALADAQALLNKRVDEISNLQKQLDDDRSKLNHWSRNPFTMSAVGFLIGVIATGYALKK